MLDQRQVQRDFRNPRRETDDQVTALEGDGAECGFRHGAAHRVIHDVRAMLSACVFEASSQIRFTVGDDDH